MPDAITVKGQSATVSFDGATVTITRGRSAPGGKGVASFPVRQISGVELTAPGIGSVGGKFTLVVAGGAQQRRGTGFMAARRDPLTVQFTYPQRREFEAMADAVRAALASAVREALTRPEPVAGVAPGGLSLRERLAQLGDLRAHGVLSETEFAAAKARVLGG